MIILLPLVPCQLIVLQKEWKHPDWRSLDSSVFTLPSDQVKMFIRLIAFEYNGFRASGWRGQRKAGRSPGWSSWPSLSGHMFQSLYIFHQAMQRTIQLERKEGRRGIIHLEVCSLFYNYIVSWNTQFSWSSRSHPPRGRSLLRRVHPCHI